MTLGGDDKNRESERRVDDFARRAVPIRPLERPPQNGGRSEVRQQADRIATEIRLDPKSARSDE
jgi:hypothetical protein